MQDTVNNHTLIVQCNKFFVFILNNTQSSGVQIQSLNKTEQIWNLFICDDFYTITSSLQFAAVDDDLSIAELPDFKIMLILKGGIWEILTCVLCNRHPISIMAFFPNLLNRKPKRCIFCQKSKFEKKKF